MSYKSNFQTRYNIGKQSEEEVLPIIRNFFKDNSILPTTKKTDRYDYKGLIKNYELKTRTNKYNQYPTTMIGLDKCEINYFNTFKGLKKYDVYGLQFINLVEQYMKPSLPGIETQREQKENPHVERKKKKNNNQI